MATTSSHPDGDSGIFGLEGDYPPNPEPFDAPTGAAASEPLDEDSGKDSNSQTIFMTIFFLVLMFLYIAFCAWYRKGKTRRSVGDGGDDSERDERRSRQRRANQVVLDESTSAAIRARESAEEQRKLEERKESIKKSLTSRLIVDDEEAAEGDEKKIDGDVPEKSAFVASTQGIITIQEEDQDNSDEENASIANPDVDIEEQSAIIKKTDTATTNETTDSSPPPSPRQESRTAPTSPSRLSLSSPRKYADALNCGSSVRHAMSTCSTQGVTCSSANSGNCGSTHCNSDHGSIHSKPKGPGEDKNGDDYPTISLLAIVGAYGEECNICLSHFQVGDRAAWSKHGSDNGDDDNSEGSRAISSGAPQDDVAGPNEGKDESDDGKAKACNHVFHEECISRWLLVRDGCPICRRTYFPEDAAAYASDNGADAAVNGGDVEWGE
ncbi:hypothetical protein ACHAXT_003967 [Thalassiosira profunda]